MTAIQQVDSYLRRMEIRLRCFAASRGAAISAGCAIALTLILVAIANRYRFAEHLLLPFRIFLFTGVACALCFALAIPISRLNRRRITRLAESRMPEFKQSLLTISERRDADNPFLELAAEDALKAAHLHGAAELVSKPWLYGSLAAGFGAIAVLVWLITAGPGYWGYGASLLWTGAAHAGSRPLYEITVRPGNRTIRRKSDQVITAQLLGFSADRVELHAKYRGATKWEEIPMQEQPSGNGYQFLFAGLSDSLEYYVQADKAQSKHFTLGVKDMPAVKRVRVALHYPSVLGLKDVVDDPGGDIRAVEGTQADVGVVTDRPLAHGVLVLENGSKIELVHGERNWLTARLPITKDGSYHVAAIDEGETIRLSDDYFIEAKKDEPPSVRIVKPGRDPHVSPIEELPVTVEAADDFGVRNLELHYSVNGEPERVVPLLKAKDVKEAQGKTTLAFEDFKVAPGDLVSFYAVAKDATHTAKSDMVFAQAEPFDYKFQQAQQMGGAGGQQDSENNISERQKEIIAATWNELKGSGADRGQIAANARFLSEVEGKLGEQAKALAERMGNRELITTGPEFQKFGEEMTTASTEMSKAVDQLRPAKWQDALQPEEKALQSLLRAEAIFRNIQVAFGQQQGGGMGSPGAGRDLARLFDLELDTAKNQYETGQSSSNAQNDQQKQIDQALEKLKQLAQRQQELAKQQSAQQSMQQRWEEEQLRREAEQLRQQIEQLAQNSQQSGQSGSASSSASSRAQQGQTPGQAQSSAMQQTANSLQRAMDEMRKATSQQDRTAQEHAAQQLAEAENRLRNMLHQEAGSSVGDLRRKADELARTQKDLADKIKQMYGAQGIDTARRNQNGAAEMPEMQGPDLGYGGYRRRFYSMPSRPTTPQERDLANKGESVAKEIEQLEKQMQEQVGALGSEQADAARKLRKALSDAEQQDLAVRAQKGADWMRQGYGAETWPVQDSVTAGMQQLREQLQQSEQALQQTGNQSGSSNDDSLQRALAEVRSLREQLQGGRQNTGNQGGDTPSIGGGSSQETADDLRRLRREFSNDREFGTYVDNALGYLRHMNGQAGLLDARINQDAARSLEKLEAELARRAGEQTQAARIGAPEQAPEKYRDAVAEYFKRLSK